MEMTKDEYIRLVEKCEIEGAMNIVYLLMVSLLSADTMTDVESCDRSIKEFEVILEALKEASVSEELRRQLNEIAEEGIRIGKRDKAIFEREGLKNYE